MTEEICTAKMQQKAILELLEEVKVLGIQNAEKKRRMEELEQYSHINDSMCLCLRGGKTAHL